MSENDPAVLYLPDSARLKHLEPEELRSLYLRQRDLTRRLVRLALSHGVSSEDITEVVFS